MSKLCPFRPYTEEQRSALVEGESITITKFQVCLKERCFAYWNEQWRPPNSMHYEILEHCKMLEKRGESE